MTPAEHLGLPDVKQVREGIIASKIAAHAADLARGNKKAIEQDLQMSIARKILIGVVKKNTQLTSVFLIKLMTENLALCVGSTAA